MLQARLGGRAARRTPPMMMAIATHSMGAGLSPRTGMAISEPTAGCRAIIAVAADARSEEHTSELPSLMRISYAVFCLKKSNITGYNVPNNVYAVTRCVQSETPYIQNYQN